VVVIAGNENVTMSLALALCDQMRVSRNEVIHILDAPDPDADYSKATPPNQWVYRLARETRSLVC
jgi:hypothetical protein